MKLNFEHVLAAMYAVISFLGIFWRSSKWQFSAVMGPAEHLGLFVDAVKGTEGYLDGLRRWPTELLLRLCLHGSIWLGGAYVCLSLIRQSSHSDITLSAKAIILGWFFVGVFNVWLFAIRSV